MEGMRGRSSGRFMRHCSRALVRLSWEISLQEEVGETGSPVFFTMKSHQGLNLYDRGFAIFSITIILNCINYLCQ